jgi:hypothetical protein
MNALTLLADNFAQNNFGDTRSGGLAGPMGLFVIVVLVIGTVLLIRNMNTRLRRLPDHFSSADAPGENPTAVEAVHQESANQEPARKESAQP